MENAFEHRWIIVGKPRLPLPFIISPVLLNVAGVSKAFGVDIILESINFRIDRREKVALVGRNGTGKTTLLKIITGDEEPDTGSVNLARGAKIGKLRQEAQVERGRTVIEEAESARSEQRELRERLDALEHRLENNPTEDELEEYATLHEHFLELEGYRAESDVRTVLMQMGFTPDEFDKPTSALSGGEKTRLALARLLLEEPDLLILDEPTNHLDLQATEWLEGWIRSYPGAILVVSHDRTFLEAGFDRFLDLRDHTIKVYPGPFAKYQQVHHEEQLRLAEVSKRQQQQIDKLDEYVRRFMNSQRTAQARGRLKMMEKLQGSHVQAPKNERGMKAGFREAKRSGEIVLEAKGLGMAFGAQRLFSGVDWTVRNGERWGVIGENGAGKSTLVKNLLGLLTPTEGSGRLGSNVTLGYFAQDVVDLDPTQSPLDYLVYDFDLKPAEARDLLGRFLITGEDVFRPIKTLSGGEKNKLVLASLTTLHPNLLVLDEPTNHLDMDSREALAEVIRDFKGTLVLVSHDRWLLEQVTDHTLDVTRKGVIEYPGSYGDYRRRQSKPGAPVAAVAVDAKPEPTLSPRELSKEIQRLTKAVEDDEVQIAKTESEIAKLEAKLAAGVPEDKLLAATEEHAKLSARLQAEMSAWEHDSLALEELKRMQG